MKGKTDSVTQKRLTRRRSARNQKRRRKKKAEPKRPEKQERATRVGLKGTRKIVGAIFEELHAKRVESLANYTVGTMHASSVAIHAIGAAYASVAEIQPKHGVKQVDRYLSNKGINVEALTAEWAKYVIGSRTEVNLIVDWTDFEPNDHSTLYACVMTTHGRATPLAWKTYKKSELTDGARTRAEHALIERLGRAIAPEVSITLVADRGFGYCSFYQLLTTLGWDYVIRFRSSIIVKHGEEAKLAKEWLTPSGRARKLTGASVTGESYQVGAVVAVQKKAMKGAWFLATSRANMSASALIKLYGRRFTIEETFRDQKDLRFGRGLYATHISKADRRDRMLMLLALAHALLTLLGAASERSGLDAYLKVNTVKRRTHSLFRQGSYWYGCLSTMREDWYERLLSAFEQILSERAQMTDILGKI
jgi:hypothetical protein